MSNFFMAKIDLIIPVRNEEKNIHLLTERIDSVMRENYIDYRVIFCDDHSTDDTVKKIKEIKNKYPILLNIKEGKIDKAFLIIEADKVATAVFLLLID